jgi:hypothetical protein
VPDVIGVPPYLARQRIATTVTRSLNCCKAEMRGLIAHLPVQVEGVLCETNDTNFLAHRITFSSSASMASLQSVMTLICDTAIPLYSAKRG